MQSGSHVCESHFLEVPSGVKVVHFNRYNYPQTRITMCYTAHFSTLNPSNTPKMLSNVVKGFSSTF